MCLAVPIKVVQLLDGDRALGEQLGVELEFSTALLDDVEVGNYVLVHTGIAIERIDENEARETLDIWNELNPSSKTVGEI